MQELWIPEFIVGILLFLHIIRPAVKSLDSNDGFAWLPLVALIIIVICFPAYGFRPELLPLLMFAAALALFSIPRQLKEDGIYGSFRKAKFFLVFPPLLLLAVCLTAAVFFTPIKDTDYRKTGVYSLKADAPDSDGKQEYFVRVYTDNDDPHPTGRPLLVLMPPSLGSLAAVDQVSGELCSLGFTVLTYTRKGFDSPAVHIPAGGNTATRAAGAPGRRHGISPAEWFRRIRVFFSRTVTGKVYFWGKAMEDARKEDLLFLLSLLRQNPMLNESWPLFHYASRNAVFLAGFDAGGAALIFAGSSLSPYGPELNPLSEIRIRGLVAIESSLWSVYREAAVEIPELPPDAGWLASVKHGLNNWFLGMRPKKITGPENIPEVSFPVLFLISGRERHLAEEKGAENRYFAMSGALKNSHGPAELVSVDGTIPFDFTDFPSRYPFITALLRGLDKAPWSDPDAPAGTAGIIANFAASVLERGDGGRFTVKSAAFPEGTRIITH